VAHELSNTQNTRLTVEQEQREALEDWNNIGLGELLLSLGEDLTRPSIIETPERMIRAWKEQLDGYTLDPDEIVEKVWEPEGAGDIIARHIFFTSLCEHHCLNFLGHADVAYRVTATGKVLGLSKIPRLIHCFSHRLQIQERLTNQIADTICNRITPVALVVRIRAQHLCCVGRGIRTESMYMATYAKRGSREDCEDLLRQIREEDK